MRSIIGVLFVAGGCLISGCVSNQTAPPSGAFDAERQRRLAEVASVEVPLPKITPYDADPVARQAYLEFYRAGYREGLTGYMSTCCLGDCPNRTARINGWYDGQLAGSSIRWKKNQ